MEISDPGVQVWKMNLAPLVKAIKSSYSATLTQAELQSDDTTHYIDGKIHQSSLSSSHKLS